MMSAFDVYRATKQINYIKELAEVLPIEFVPIKNHGRSLYKMPYKNDIYCANTFSVTMDDKHLTEKWRDIFFFESLINEKFGIKKIVENPAKRATAVIWNDGKATVVKRAEDDSDDIYFAVASALAIRAYGSNSAFKKIIDTKHEVYTPKKESAPSIKDMMDSLGGRNDEV